MNLQGKRILVTGSTMGIGYATAEKMLSAGANVVIHGRSTTRVHEAMQTLSAQGRVFGVCGDVSNLQDCREIIEQSVYQLGGLDVLCNNAGVAYVNFPEDVTDEHWDALIDTNLRSCFFLTQYALPELKISKGTVIMTASVAGTAAGPTDNFLYGTFKKGLISLSRSLAVELAPCGIRVTCIAPGYIDTPMVASENEANGGFIYDFIKKTVPLGRIGTTAECASAIAYLASDDAAYLIGSEISPDGGLSAIRTWGGRS